MNNNRITDSNPYGFERGDKAIVYQMSPKELKDHVLDDYDDIIGKEGILGVLTQSLCEFFWEENERRCRKIVYLLDLIPGEIKNKDFKKLLKKR